jgi:hypothetical protein
MLCIGSPAGYEEFFKEVGTAVATRTTPPPKVDAAREAAFIKKGKYSVNGILSLSCRHPKSNVFCVAYELGLMILQLDR